MIFFSSHLLPSFLMLLPLLPFHTFDFQLLISPSLINSWLFLPVTLRLFSPLAPSLRYTFYTWCRYMVACLVLPCNISGKRSADMCSSCWPVLQPLCYLQKSWPRTNSSKNKERAFEKLQWGKDAHANRKKLAEAYKNYWKHLPSINYYIVMGKWCHLVPNPSSFSHSSNLLFWLFCPLLYRNTHTSQTGPPNFNLLLRSFNLMQTWKCFSYLSYFKGSSENTGR